MSPDSVPTFKFSKCRKNEKWHKYVVMIARGIGTKLLSIQQALSIISDKNLSKEGLGFKNWKTEKANTLEKVVHLSALVTKIIKNNNSQSNFDFT